MVRISPRPENSVKIRQLDELKVHEMALEALGNHLSIQGKGPQSSPEKILNVLLGAAVNCSSIEQECQDRPGAPSPNSVRAVLNDSLELERTEMELNSALGQHLDARYWARPQSIAVDLHEQPYHGSFMENPNEIRRGPAKSGTTHFHSYATAYVVRNGRRLTLALHFVRYGEAMSTILDTLKARVEALGIEVGLWLADKAFCSVQALKWFNAQKLAYVPLTVRGKKEPPSATRILAASKHSHWASYSMSNTEGSLDFSVAVVHRPASPSRGGRMLGAVTLLYAVVGQDVSDGVEGRDLKSVYRLYRKRFGIESSYRQMLRARFTTTSRSPELRLLAVGIALLLRNLWVLCQWILGAEAGAGACKVNRNFRFKKLLKWLSRMVDFTLGLHTLYPLQAPSPLRF